jgi:hypothetical protein
MLLLVTVCKQLFSLSIPEPQERCLGLGLPPVTARLTRDSTKSRSVQHLSKKRTSAGGAARPRKVLSLDKLEVRFGTRQNFRRAQGGRDRHSPDFLDLE